MNVGRMMVRSSPAVAVNACEWGETNGVVGTNHSNTMRTSKLKHVLKDDVCQMDDVGDAVGHNKVLQKVKVLHIRILKLNCEMSQWIDCAQAMVNRGVDRWNADVRGDIAIGAVLGMLDCRTRVSYDPSCSKAP
jgi:hypothetical protein